MDTIDPMIALIAAGFVALCAVGAWAIVQLHRIHRQRWPKARRAGELRVSIVMDLKKPIRDMEEMCARLGCDRCRARISAEGAKVHPELTTASEGKP